MIVFLLTLWLFFSGCVPAGWSGSRGERDIDAYQVARQIHALVNRERQRHGLSLLAWDEKLARIALAHSQDMARREYVAHISPEGEGPTARAKAQGYECVKTEDKLQRIGVAENIAFVQVTVERGQLRLERYTSVKQLAEETVRGWMESTGHRKNILTPSFDREGVGVTFVQTRQVFKMYVTQNFC